MLFLKQSYSFGVLSHDCVCMYKCTNACSCVQVKMCASKLMHSQVRGWGQPWMLFLGCYQPWFVGTDTGWPVNSKDLPQLSSLVQALQADLTTHTPQTHTPHTHRNLKMYIFVIGKNGPDERTSYFINRKLETNDLPFIQMENESSNPR